MIPSDNLSILDILLKKVYTFYDTIWKDKWQEQLDSIWLSNFQHIDSEEQEKEKINMLYLLSKFMYFGNSEVRGMLLSLYRDLFRYPIIEAIRKSNNDTVDLSFIERCYENELECTRFLGIGNPSESGVHLLYYFRQECGLSKANFINESEIFSTYQVDEIDAASGVSIRYLKSEIGNKSIKRYVFIDDFCGSGEQAKGYLSNLCRNIKFENPEIEIKYLMLFGTDNGISELRKVPDLDGVEAIFVLDESFKTFSDTSRYFRDNLDARINKQYCMDVAERYGKNLFYPPLGHGDCQLLFGLFHNTPDNSLPIFWSSHNDWRPIFKRFNKIY